MLRSLTFFCNGLLILAGGVGSLTRLGDLLSLGMAVWLGAAVINIVLMRQKNTETFYAKLGVPVNAIALLIALAIGVHAGRLLVGAADAPEGANAAGLLLSVLALVCIVTTALSLVVYMQDIKRRDAGSEAPRI
ncbi:MAG: hypothetical protein WD118_02835 [Phycisphaeraceae bacterium]